TGMEVRMCKLCEQEVLPVNCIESDVPGAENTQRRAELRVQLTSATSLSGGMPHAEKTITCRLGHNPQGKYFLQVHETD
ncbi:Uncharacterized protein DAT39_023091, partial [Clarias magur]